MQKVLLLLTFITSSLFSMELALVEKPSKIRIETSSMFVPSQLGCLELYRGKKDFYIRKDGEKHTIKKYFMDPMLRGITKKQLQNFFIQGYLSVNQMEDGEYSLKAKMRLNGGGPIGASIGVFLGKAAVSLVGHGAIQLVALATGPGYIPTVIALEACLGAQIEAASLAGAVAGGIALGVATGPV